jgi:hypothetical protein
VVERRVARLEEEAVSGSRGDRGDGVARAAALDGRPDVAGRVGVPASVGVVDVDDRDAGCARAGDRLAEPGQPAAERGEERVAVLVVEAVDDVDQQESVAAEGAVRPATQRTAAADRTSRS